MVKKLLLHSLLVFLLVACKKDMTVYPNGSATYNNEVNNWIYQNMKYYYLWSTSMPAITNTNLTEAPMKYFYNILNGYGTTDRFSWIDSSATNLTNQLNGINTVLGIKYTVFNVDITKTNLAFVIAYVFSLPQLCRLN